MPRTGAADQLDALVVEVLGISSCKLARLLLDEVPRLARGEVGAEELVDGRQVDRQGIYLALVHAVDLVHVVGEAGESVDVLPHPFVGCVEKVGAVPVDLNTGLLFLFAVGIAANMVAAVDDNDLQAELSGSLFCDCQAKKAGPYDDKVSGHKISWFECGQHNVVQSLLL
jgi:hypothetical protein